MASEADVPIGGHEVTMFLLHTNDWTRDGSDTAGERPVALVTGSTLGIGAAIEVRLLDRGMTVVFNSRTGVVRVSDRPPRSGITGRAAPDAVHVAADVGEPLAVAHLIQEVDQLFGRLDLVVNNAGVGPSMPHRDFDAVTDHLWDVGLGTNLRGHHFVGISSTICMGGPR